MQREGNAVIKIDLNNLEASASQPQLKKLLDEGWTILSSFPADDNGKAYLVLILEPPKPSTHSYTLIEMLIFIALISLIIIEIIRGFHLDV